LERCRGGAAAVRVTGYAAPRVREKSNGIDPRQSLNPPVALARNLGTRLPNVPTATRQEISRTLERATLLLDQTDQAFYAEVAASKGSESHAEGDSVLANTLVLTRRAEPVAVRRRDGQWKHTPQARWLSAGADLRARLQPATPVGPASQRCGRQTQLILEVRGALKCDRRGYPPSDMMVVLGGDWTKQAELLV
jgi:hypothetical protein